MASWARTGALLRNSRAIGRAAWSVDEAAVAPFGRHIVASRQPLYPSLVPHRCSPACTSPRHFSQTSAAARKQNSEQKASKAASRSTPPAKPSSPPSDAPKPNPDDPYDLSDLEHALAKGTEHYLNELSKARSGGRFNPDVLGTLRVRPDKKSAETFPLHELAAVVPRRGSRRVSVLVHEPAHVRAVMTAIQASPDFNQQPQRADDNELELVLTVEAEDRDETARRLRDIVNAWRQQVRDARHKRDQVVKKWWRDRKITDDDYALLGKEMQKVQDKKMAEIKAKEKEVEGKSG